MVYQSSLVPAGARKSYSERRIWQGIRMLGDGKAESINRAYALFALSFDCHDNADVGSKRHRPTPNHTTYEQHPSARVQTEGSFQCRTKNSIGGALLQPRSAGYPR